MERETEIQRRRGLGAIIDAMIETCAGSAPAPPGRPASEQELAALERHWGRPLPLPYRWVLRRHNGIPRLWFDLELLPIEAILREGPEMRASRHQRRRTGDGSLPV